MKNLFKKPIVVIWMVLLLLAIFILAFKGLQFGVDFSGGTSFQIVLEEPVSTEEMSGITNVIARRLDWLGSKDATVRASGEQYIVAQLAESDAEEISNLRELLLRQGKFEAVLNGEILFIGEDIRTIYKDPARGYGTLQLERKGSSQWTLPFLLSPTAAENFSKMTFHRCSLISPGEYDCEKTYFFMDRPTDYIFIVDIDTYTQEKTVSTAPGVENIDFIAFEEILDQVNTKYYIVDDALTNTQLENITSDYNTYQKVIITKVLENTPIHETLNEMGYKVKVVNKEENMPWIWSATGLQSIISLTEGVTNMNAPSMDSSRFEVFNNLIITGHSSSLSDAKNRLDSLTVLLEAGSLPIAIQSISTESISPFLGKEFLKYSLLIALFALLTVALVLFIRYRMIHLSIPIMFVGFSEIVILLGLLSLISFRLDLAAVAGILANIGTGVDHQIIITDELIKGKKKEDSVSHASLVSKIRVAFFIVYAAVATTIATMLPVIFSGLGLGKLVGFATTVVFGALIGTLVTRPSFAQIAKAIVQKYND